MVSVLAHMVVLMEKNGFSHREFKKNKNKLELCPHPWIRELR